ncbi:hypothetical protein J7L67_03995 [bacterium]|nr:hypothetical protein [bacterium]
MARAKKKTAISLYQSLLRNIISLIIFLSCSILIIIHFATTSVKMNISRILIERVTNRVKAELKHFFKSVEHNLTSVRVMAENSVINLSNPQEVSKLFFSMMQSTPKISSINIGDEHGRGFLLLKKNGKWLARYADNSKNPGLLNWKKFNSSYVMEKQWTEKKQFDPRAQPWYICFTNNTGKQDTPLKEQVYWTNPYTFFTTQSPGITVSTVIKTPDGTRYVLALDILLTDITTMTSEIKVTQHGDAFIMSEEGSLIGLPKHYANCSAEDRKNLFFSSPLNSPFKPIKNSYNAWLKNKSKQKSSFFFKCNNENWIGGIYPFQLNNDRKFLISIVFPEKDFLYELTRQTYIVICAALISMIVAILLVHKTTIHYSQDLEKIVSQSERIKNLDLSRKTAVSSNLKEIRQLADVQEKMRVALESFSKYVPVNVVRELLDQGKAAKIGGKIDYLTILFTDIRGFTSIAESITPKQLTDQLAEYFEVVLNILKPQHATVDKFIGDAIVAFWGAPTSIKNHEFHAVKAVIKAHHGIGQLNRKWTKQGKPAFPTTFGLAAGQVIVGNIGASSRLNYTVLGDIVNTANRIENINRFYGTEMLASQEIKKATQKNFLWRKIDTVQLVGKTSITDIFEIVGPHKDMTDAMIEKTLNYEKALNFYKQKKFTSALKLLEKIIRQYHDDTPSIRLKNLCETFKEYPPSSLWNGITKFSHK